MALRLDAQHDELLAVLAKRFGRSKTEVVEMALDELAAQEFPPDSRQAVSSEVPTASRSSLAGHAIR